MNHRSPKECGGTSLLGMAVEPLFGDSENPTTLGGKTAAPPRTKAVRGILWVHRTSKRLTSGDSAGWTGRGWTEQTPSARMARRQWHSAGEFGKLVGDLL